MECNLGWNHMLDFKIERARNASSIWNHKYDFRLKLHDTRFSYHFIKSIWNRPNTRLGQFKYFIDAVLSRLEIKFIHFWRGRNKSFGNRSCKICRMILFVFYFPAISLITLKKPWNLTGCFVFSAASSLAGKKVRFKAKNGAIREYLMESSPT